MSDQLFARSLALAGANEQAEFLNEFCSTLMGVCKGKEGNQVWYIAEHLDKSAADLLKEIAEHREYHAAEYKKDQLRRDELRREIWDLEKQLKAKREQDND